MKLSDIKFLFLYTFLFFSNQTYTFSLDSIWGRVKIIFIQVIQENRASEQLEENSGTSPLPLTDPFFLDHGCCICCESIDLHTSNGLHIPICLPCGCKGKDKSMHLDCAMQALKHNQKCPYCRTTIDNHTIENINALQRCFSEKKCSLITTQFGFELREMQVKKLQTKLKEALRSIESVKSDQIVHQLTVQRNQIQQLKQNQAKLKVLCFGAASLATASTIALGYYYYIQKQ